MKHSNALLKTTEISFSNRKRELSVFYVLQIFKSQVALLILPTRRFHFLSLNLVQVHLSSHQELKEIKNVASTSFPLTLFTRTLSKHSRDIPSGSEKSSHDARQDHGTSTRTRPQTDDFHSSTEGLRK